MSGNAQRLRSLNDALLTTGQDYSDILLDSALEIERLRLDWRELATTVDGQVAVIGKLHDEIERLREAKALVIEATDDLRETIRTQQAEIERLRAYIVEIEKWKDKGERILEPAAQWSPGDNVMVRSSVMFKFGAWWADRPWRVREALGDD